ncbi:hypothetical protein CMUS01_06186 [Colletotrichum musicola]|uniref:Uncharacterized protein n=1 Tax=Colletotrichum musicola TaxID=2175873 RepID=A0A8H6KMP4_9PEZI|nr:hypothetical protein CMUS01_06186 [Colletotrichum musicola]
MPLPPDNATLRHLHCSTHSTETLPRVIRLWPKCNTFAFDCEPMT